MHSRLKKSLQFFLIFTLSVGWIFSRVPQIYNFPPEVQKAEAAVTRYYLRDTQTEAGTTGTPGSKGSIVDLSITQGTTAALGSGNSQDASFVVAKKFIYNVGTDINGTSFPVSVDMNAVSASTMEWQFRVERLNSSNAVQAASTNSGPYNTNGIKTANLTLSTTWAAGDRVSVTVDIRRVSGSGNRTWTMNVNDADSYIDLPLPDPPVDTPIFDNGTATYNNDVSVAITVASPASAVICYTTDGSTPAASTPGTCSTGTTYSGPVSITATGTVLKAIGTKASYSNSTVQSATYTLAVASPGFGTNGGSFLNDTSTSFSSATTGTVFCSTLDGSTPAAATPGTCSTGATGASATVIATSTAVKVLGTKANYVNSGVQTSNAFILTVGAIISSPGAGSYIGTQSVSLSIATTTGAVAHYTTDGSAVTCSSPTYSGAFNVSSTTTVKAIGCKTNYVSDTAISDLYTIGLSTAIEVRAQNYSTSVSNIIFPEGSPGSTVSQPYNNIDGSGNPQTFGGAGTAKPVITLYNGGASTLIIWYNIATFTNGVVSNEYYLVNNKTAACADANCITGSVIFDTDTTTGATITAGAGNEKDLYLKISLGAPVGKSGTSTITILGESL